MTFRQARQGLGFPPPRDSEIIEDLLEIAFRCCADHGADFGKPAKHHKALERAKAIAARVGDLQRYRGQRGPDLIPRRKRAK